MRAAGALFLAMLVPATAFSQDIISLVEMGKPESTDYRLDARCAALYLALVRVSERDGTTNGSSYRESAELFAGFATLQLRSEASLTEADAKSQMINILRENREFYWQSMLDFENAVSQEKNVSTPILDSDIPFCVARGGAYASGVLPHSTTP
jgi:hypothetical protein